MHPLCEAGTHVMPGSSEMFDTVDVFICEECGKPIEAADEPATDTACKWHDCDRIGCDSVFDSHHRQIDCTCGKHPTEDALGQ